MAPHRRVEHKVPKVTIATHALPLKHERWARDQIRLIYGRSARARVAGLDTGIGTTAYHTYPTTTHLMFCIVPRLQ